jgi:hypothetical protein
MSLNGTRALWFFRGALAALFSGGTMVTTATCDFQNVGRGSGGEIETTYEIELFARGAENTSKGEMIVISLKDTEKSK